LSLFMPDLAQNSWIAGQARNDISGAVIPGLTRDPRPQ
jgi:hypothetical protein